MSRNTDRIYRAAQEDFMDWCRMARRQPFVGSSVAGYLTHVQTARGASCVPVHLSAIGRMFRSMEIPLDTKSGEIQAVVMPARQAMRS